jgi:hypothetical protein
VPPSPSAPGACYSPDEDCGLPQLLAPPTPARLARSKFGLSSSLNPNLNRYLHVYSSLTGSQIRRRRRRDTYYKTYILATHPHPTNEPSNLPAPSLTHHTNRERLSWAHGAHTWYTWQLGLIVRYPFGMRVVKGRLYGRCLGAASGVSFCGRAG